MKRVWFLVFILAAGGVGQGLRFWGTWDMTLELLPTLRIYGSNLILDCSFAPGWRIESETKIYSGGVYQYQNFYVSGSLGDIGVWGKIYFHAKEVRYQKMWLNAETKFGDLTARLSFNHWAKYDDYTSTDRSMFGDWPCYVLVPAAPVIEAADLVATWRVPSSPDPREGQQYYVHGTIVAYYPTTPSTYVNLYLVANYPNKRFIVYIRFADFSPPITPSDVLARLGANSWSDVVGKEICVFGTLVNYTSPSGVDNPEIVLANSPNQLNDLNLGACQPAMQSVRTEPFLNWRYRLNWANYTVNIDFGDCCTGTTLRKLQVDVTGLPLCCGLFLDASLSFVKQGGFEKIAFTLGDLALCCGVTTKIAAEFTPTAKKVELKPSWHGLAGCFTIYGDALFSGSTWQGIEVWGFMVNCYFPTCGYFRILTAFDPAKFWIDDSRNITASRTQPSYYSALFRTGEFEYMSAKFCMSGCCGGEVSFILEGWFGSGTYLFGFRRFKFDFQLPIAANITLFSKAQWDFSKASPLEWFDVGWSISF